jgi:hypothetical protein
MSSSPPRRSLRLRPLPRSNETAGLGGTAATAATLTSSVPPSSSVSRANGLRNGPANASRTSPAPEPASAPPGAAYDSEVEGLKKELEEREEAFKKENKGRFPKIQDINSDKDWSNAQLRFDKLTSRDYVSQLVGPDVLVSTNALCPLRSFEVGRKFEQLVRNDINMAAVERAFQRFAQESSSAELNQHISTRRKEHSKHEPYFLTREGLRKVRSYPTPMSLMLRVLPSIFAAYAGDCATMGCAQK